MLCEPVITNRAAVTLGPLVKFSYLVKVTDAPNCLNEDPPKSFVPNPL